MASNIFINYSLSWMRLSYKIFGKNFTNLIIEKSAGGLFTSGTTIESLLQDIKILNSRKIGGVANYVLEGIDTMDKVKIEKGYQEMIDSIISMTKDDGSEEGHFALKLTAMISIDLMTKLSTAQLFFLKDILKFDE